MTQLSTITIPSAVQAPTTRYIPEVHSYGRPYFPELDASDTTKAALVADIASAQHEDILRVIAFDLTTGKCWDASKEIARDVLNVVLTERGRVPRWCEDFLEQHLGCAVVATASREAA